MSKLYCHTPVKRIVRDFLSHLDITDKNAGSLESLNQEFTALILSPVADTKSFRQVFPLFIKKLSKKFKSYLKKQGVEKKATFQWDEGLVIVLESLEDFLSLKWKVSYHRLEHCNDPEIEEFKQPLVSMNISDEIYVSFELLTEKKENKFDFNEVEGAINEIRVDDDEDESAELVVEEIKQEKTEADIEMERKRKEEDDKRLEEEFLEFKNALNNKIAELKELQASYEFRKVISVGDIILDSLTKAKSSKREHAIYLTERRIEVCILLSTVKLGNGTFDQVVKLLQPLGPVAKKGPVDTYVDLLLLLGDAYFKLEDYEEAMKAYSQALASRKKFSKEEKMTINAKRAKTAIKFEEDDGIGYVK